MALAQRDTMCYSVSMDARTQAFEKLKDHPWLGRRFKELKAADLQFCRDVLAKHVNTSKDDFMGIAVRLFLGHPSKPKTWVAIEELLVCANSSLP